MDANPLGVDPRTDLEHGGELIGVRIVAGGNERIEALDDRLEGAFKCRECGSHLACRDTETSADVDLDFLESWFAAESADVASSVRTGRCQRPNQPCRS